MSNPPRTIRRDTRFFISAVTRELGSVRKLVKKGLEDNDYHVVEQDNFSLDYRDLVAKLRERINSCDAVIHIAGHAYGAEPKNRPADAPRRSYAQLEHDIAVELNKPVYVFLTGDGFPTDKYDTEPPELQELQEAHRRSLTSIGRDYSRTASTEQLDQKIRSLKLKVERLEEELQQVDVKLAASSRRLGRRLVAVAVLVVAVLGTVGYIGWRQQVEHRRQEAEIQAQEQEREKQERERIAAEADRKQNQTIKDIQRDIAEGLLQELLSDKSITAEQARERALKRLASVKLPLAEIESLIDRKIPKAAEATLSPLDKARAALAKGDYDAVFPLAAEQTRQDRELAMLEGTAALARFRQTPSPEWNIRALAAFRRALALTDPESATEWKAWTKAALSAASVLHNMARYAEAEPLLRDGLRIRETRIGSDSPEVAVALNNLALLLEDTNRLSVAEPLLRRALAIDDRSHGPDHPDVAGDLNNLAELLRTTNRLSEAEPLYRRALAIDERSYGPNHPDVARDLSNLAELLRTTNRLSEAEPLYRRALAIDERSHGPDHPNVAVRLNNLAVLLRTTNRLPEAEPLYRRALAIFERSYGPNHPHVATDLNNLARLLDTTNRLSEAEPLYRRALAIFERSYGPDHPHVATDLNNLAGLLEATNRLSEAEPLYRRALAIFERSYGPDNPNRRVVMESYRGLLATLKLAEPEIAARIKGASEETTKFSPIVPEVERLLGPAQPVADVLSALDRQYREQGKPAVYFLGPKEPIAPRLDELLRPNEDGLSLRGFVTFRAGAHADAVVLYESALELMPDQPMQVPLKLRTRMNRAAALRELGLVDEARDELSRLVPEIEKSPATESGMKGRAHYHLTLCQWRLGERAAAETSAEKSLAMYNSAPKAEAFIPALRQQSEELVAALKDGKAPPPLAAIDGKAAIEAARARYRAREALTKLGLKEPSAPLLDPILGPAKPTTEVFDALDRQYREQGKPAVWFLPLSEPISPHLDELLGKASR